MHRMPRRPLRAALGALLLASGLALSGCAGGAAPAASPTDSPSASALAFASDDAAYTAAIAVYEDYVNAENLRYEGRVGPDPANYLTAEAQEVRSSAIAAVAANGHRLTGRSEVVGIEGESFAEGMPTILACHDLSALRLVDADGADVTPAERQERAAVRVTFADIGGDLRIMQTDAFARC